MDFSVFGAVPGYHILVKPQPPYPVVAISNELLQNLNSLTPAVVGKPFSSLVSSRDLFDEIELSFNQICRSKQPHEIALQAYFLNTPNDAVQYWKVQHTPVLDDDGELTYIVHSATHESQRLKADQKQTFSEGMEKAYQFFMNAPVIIGFLKGDDYNIELANEGLLEVWGRTKEVIGKPLLQALPELQQQGIYDLLERVRTTGKPFHAYDFPITLHRGGKDELLFFDFVYRPFYEDGKKAKADGVISVGYDVTEKVLARKKIQQNEEKYSTLINLMDQGFCVLEMIFDENNQPVDYRFVETNPMFEKQTGLKNAEGKTALELVPNLEPHWFQLYGKVALTGKPIHFSEGSESMGRWFDVYAFAIEKGSSKVALLFTDITERRNAEEALRTSENNLRSIIMQSPVAMGLLKGKDFVVELANEKLYELWGKGSEELLHKPIFEGLPEAKNQGFEELLSKVYETGETYSALAIPVQVPRQGEIKKFYINLLYEPMKSADGKVTEIMVVATDVTNEVVTRLKIEESNRELQFAMNVMPQMVWVTLPNGYHDFFNEVWYNYTGLNEEQSVDNGWSSVIHPADLQRTIEVWNKSLAAGSLYEIEYRIKRHDGEYRWFLGRALPLKDEAGKITKWFGTCTDIHDQKSAAQMMEETVKERTSELQITIQELQRSNANLEDFAYAASHDLKEPIRKIRTFSDRLKLQLEDRLSQHELYYFQRMDRATMRMQQLIDDLLAYSHVATNEYLEEEIDLNKKLVQVLEDLELEIAQKQAKISVGDLPVIKGHRRQMQQLFQNLVSNALKFHKPGEVPEINISSSIVKGQQINSVIIPPDYKEKLFHQIIFSDNGIGFEQIYADRIFKMFQRLHGKAEYDGTGIGLSIARKVLENHHGFISASSQPGHGATFTILLPVEGREG